MTTTDPLAWDDREKLHALIAQVRCDLETRVDVAISDYEIGWVIEAAAPLLREQTLAPIRALLEYHDARCVVRQVEERRGCVREHYLAVKVADLRAALGDPT